MILGLDISTSVTGFTVLDLDGNLVELGHFELSKIKGTMWDKVDVMKVKLHNLCKKYTFTNIFIEEPLSKFSRGKSSSATISLLMRFNGILSYIIHENIGIELVYYGPTPARKICGLKMLSKTACKKQKIDWKPQKEQAFDQMNARPPFNGTYEWPLKRTGRLKDYCYDEMDSYVIARAGFIELKNPSVAKVVARKKTVAKKKRVAKKRVSKKKVARKKVVRKKTSKKTPASNT